MSGIIPSGIVTVAVPLLDESYGSQIASARFPSRIKITSISFTVSDPIRSDTDNAGIWYLQATKYRRPRPDPGNEYPALSAHNYNLWTDDAELRHLISPHIDTTAGYNSNPCSTIASVPDRAVWHSDGDVAPYTGDIAQMDPDEWLEFYLDRHGGRPGPLDSGLWKTAGVTIFIAYEGATNLD